MDFIFWHLIIPISIGYSMASIGYYYFKKQKIYRYPANGWLDIKKHPIPEDIQDFIATDGKEVQTKYSVKWGPHGDIFLNEYKKTYIKYWQPLPEAPKK